MNHPAPHAASPRLSYFRLSLRLRPGFPARIEALVRAAFGHGLHLRFVHRRLRATRVFGIDAGPDARAEMAALITRLRRHPGVRAIRWEVIPAPADASAPFA